MHAKDGGSGLSAHPTPCSHHSTVRLALPHSAVTRAVPEPQPLGRLPEGSTLLRLPRKRPESQKATAPFRSSAGRPFTRAPHSWGAGRLGSSGSQGWAVTGPPRAQVSRLLSLLAGVQGASPQGRTGQNHSEAWSGAWAGQESSGLC